jgi:hypothetical protein
MWASNSRAAASQGENSSILRQVVNDRILLHTADVFCQLYVSEDNRLDYIHYLQV